MIRVNLALALSTALLSSTAMAIPHGGQTVRAPRPNANTPGTTCMDTPKLGYSNGPLIQHVKVVDVFYSPGNKYKAMLEGFYGSITQSAYFDWLIEYNIGSYKISRGSFVSSFEDVNPAPAATAAIQTINPETYLKSLLATAGKLPAPDDDTMYMLHFPDRIDPTDGNGSSCVQPMGDFCAYHASYAAAGGQMVRYGVIPDQDAAGCTGGCGPTGFAGWTDVASHELIEAITDPDNGTGWYDANGTQQTNCGEIGDICAVGGTMETAVIGGFTVQKEWSNKNNGCIGSDPNAVVNDFTVAVAPASVSVPVGGTATVMVTLTKTTGVAENVALTAPTPPTGLTAALVPPSVTSGGGTSVLTLTAGPMLTPGMTLSLTVKGTGSTVSETAQVSVTIVAPPDMAMTGGGGGAGGSGGGNGNRGSAGGCSVSGGSITGSWAFAGLLLLALAFRRRRS